MYAWLSIQGIDQWLCHINVSFSMIRKISTAKFLKHFLKKSIINLELCILHLRIKNLQVEFTIHPLGKKYGNQHPLADEIRTTGSGKQLTPSPTLHPPLSPLKGNRIGNFLQHSKKILIHHEIGHGNICKKSMTKKPSISKDTFLLWIFKEKYLNVQTNLQRNRFSCALF